MNTHSNSTIPAPERPSMPKGYGISQKKEGMVSWVEVERRLTQARNYWVASTRADGRPHAMPVWGLWLDGRFYFSTDPASAKGRNIARDPRVSVHLESGDEVVVLEGRLETVSGKAELARFADAYHAKYQFRPDVTQGAYYRLRHRLALAWQEKDYPTSATRWRFPGAGPA